MIGIWIYGILGILWGWYNTGCLITDNAAGFRQWPIPYKVITIFTSIIVWPLAILCGVYCLVKGFD